MKTVNHACVFHSVARPRLQQGQAAASQKARRTEGPETILVHSQELLKPGEAASMQGWAEAGSECKHKQIQYAQARQTRKTERRGQQRPQQRGSAHQPPRRRGRNHKTAERQHGQPQQQTRETYAGADLAGLMAAGMDGYLQHHPCNSLPFTKHRSIITESSRATTPPAFYAWKPR